jgi:hypothetical protein
MTFVSDTASPNNGPYPVFDYSSRDYASIFADLMARKTLFLPEWTSTSNADFGVVLLQLYSYVGDLLGYYCDRLAGEAFIQTATQASSVLNLAAMLDYQPGLSTAASVLLQIVISPTLSTPVTIPAGTEFSTLASVTVPPVVFSTIEALVIQPLNVATPSSGAGVGFVQAAQGNTYTDQPVGTSNGAINQTYALLYNPVSQSATLGGVPSTEVYVDLGNGPQLWTYVQSLILSGPYDQVYTYFVDANQVFYLIFGDGINGYVPPLGSPITCTYQTNSGSIGNVAAQTIVEPLAAIVGLSSVTNPSAATGGAPAQSIQSIRASAPASLRTNNRAVTVDDIETLALQASPSSVQWASAQQATYQLVNLFIAPAGGGNPTAALVATVQSSIDAVVMANTTVTIMDPTYVPINIAVELFVLPTYGNTATQTLVTNALATLLALVNTGFGFRVALGIIYQTILAQAGVNYAFVTSLNRQMLAMLTSALTNGDTYTTLSVSELPEAVFGGDQIVLNSLATSPTQSVIVSSGGAPAGATSIPVNSFVANATYTVGTAIQDTSGTSDCVLLENEIPVAGAFVFTTSGGLAGS